MQISTIFRTAALLGMSCIVAERASASPVDCTNVAMDACYFSFTPANQAGRVHFYSSLDPSAKKSVGSITRALVAMHGHPRDANETFNAALAAVKAAGVGTNTLVVAPVYQVATAQANKCSTKGVPTAVKGDLTWTCETWLAGGVSTGPAGISSFVVMDALIVQLKRDFPDLTTITVAGFSAGAQMVQHYIGFAADVATPDLKVRYVVSDPGAWLYFDPERVQPALNGAQVAWSQCQGGVQGLGDCELKIAAPNTSCPSINSWKYGLDKLPSGLSRDAAQARAHYAAADVSYIEGALDSSPAKGAYYGILDKSCAANAQGPYRMQRGIIYAFYDRTLLAPDKNRIVTIVPKCGHDVACVFPSKQAQAVLFGQ
jgi:hypothetical protein